VGPRIPLESCAYLWPHPMTDNEKTVAENVLRLKELDEKACKMIGFKIPGCHDLCPLKQLRLN
jgi:hypothetical protein